MKLRLGLFAALLLAFGPPAVGATNIEGFATFVNTRCIASADGSKKVGDKFEAKNEKKCFNACRKNKRCKQAHYHDASRTCVLFRSCGNYDREEGWSFAGRVAKKNKKGNVQGYFRSDVGTGCSDCNARSLHEKYNNGECKGCNKSRKSCGALCRDLEKCAGFSWNSEDSFPCFLFERLNDMGGGNPAGKVYFKKENSS